MTAGLPERHASMARAVGGPDAVPPVAVRLVADLVCPWCYIGFTRLGRLLGEAELAWHPFLLNPNLPPGGVSRGRYLERKFGSLAQAQTLNRRIQEVGSREGIRFSFAPIQVQPSTVLAHGLVLTAAEAGRGRAAAAALFRAFFEDGADIGDRSVLAGLAARLGLPDRSEDEGLVQRVMEAHRAAAGYGINGVPITVLGDDHVIAGAQPTEALRGLLDLERYRSGGSR